MKSRIEVIGIFLIPALIAVQSCNNAGTGAEAAGDGIRILSEDGAWCWFGDPRAIYHEGTYRKTYTGWVDHEGSVWAGCFDHDSRQTTSHKVHPKLLADDHNNPTLHILPDGRLLLFYAAHQKNSPLYMVRSKLPENITEWDPAAVISPNDLKLDRMNRDWYSYPMVESLAEENGRIFLFYRGLNRKHSVSVSADSGRTWSKGRPLFPPDSVKPGTRPYLKVASNGKDRIHLFFTDDHPGFRMTAIYYVCYRDGMFFKADGTVVREFEDLPMNPAEADLVYDAAPDGKPAWLWDVADVDGSPVLAYIRFDTDSDHICCYARWNGNSWESHDLVNSGGWFHQTPDNEEKMQRYYSGGMAIDHEDPSVVYISMKINGIFEIERRETPDNGKTWKSEAITRDSRNDNVRPFAVRNAGPGNPVQVMWMTNEIYRGYRDYRSSIRTYIEK
jgi:hypothetical protein